MGSLHPGRTPLLGVNTWHATIRPGDSLEMGIGNEIGPPPLQRLRRPSGWLRIIFASRSFASANPADGTDAGKSAAILLATLIELPPVPIELYRCTVFELFLVRIVTHNVLPSVEA
jgi:hypothetical protein